MSVNNKLGRKWKKAIAASFKGIISAFVPRGPDQNYTKHLRIFDVSAEHLISIQVRSVTA
jgi:hypothetical protein